MHVYLHLIFIAAFTCLIICFIATFIYLCRHIYFILTEMEIIYNSNWKLLYINKKYNHIMNVPVCFKEFVTETDRKRLAADSEAEVCRRKSK